MEIERTIPPLRQRLRAWRSSGDRIALVPTMGNLHAGHLALVERARELADRVVVSLFVNPTQFGAGEDFSSYPRTFQQDVESLTQAETDLLFAPEVKTLYPGGADGGSYVEVPQLSEVLCGASRPGHFRGVATVVCKLFNVVQPEIALFGEKDYQQLLVIRRMTRDLCFPIEIVGVPTVRDDDGLALSSRNAYLTEEQRRKAPLLYRLLTRCRERILAGERDYAALGEEARQELRAGGFEPDYFEIRNAADLTVPDPAERRLVILAAARLGRARLIDNVTLSL